MARFEGWHHLQIEGDKDAARALIPLARKVLGAAVEQAAHNSLGVHKIIHRLPDGGHIVGEVIGSQHRVTINVPQGGGLKKPIQVFDDFVFSSGDRGFVDGSPVWPSVILRMKNDESWTAYFYSSSSPGADSSTAPKTGNYINAFPLFQEKSYCLYPASKTWMDAEGNAVNYTAPVGPFEIAYRHPATLYGVSVHALGRLVFSLSQADADAGWRVLSAARRDNIFYALIAKLGALPDDSRPAPSAPQQVWATKPFLEAACSFALLKIPAAEADDPITGQRYLKAKPSETVQIWSDSLIRAYGLWEFNEDCSEVVGFQLPADTQLAYTAGPSGTFTPSTTDTLTTTTFRMGLAIGQSSATLNVTTAGNIIYEAQGRTMALDKVDAYTLDYVIGSTRLKALRAERVTIGASTGFNETQRHILYADLKNSWYVFRELVWEVIGSDGTMTVRYIAVAPDGGETVIAEDAPASFNPQLAPSLGIYLWNESHFKTLDDIATLTPSGLARVLASAYGTFWVDSMPASPNPSWFGLATTSTTLATIMALKAKGASFGGVSVSQNGVTWDSTVGLGWAGDGAGLDYYYNSATAQPIRLGASTPRALAFMTEMDGTDVYHLTNGELSGYYGGDAAMNGKRSFGAYLLGKPLGSQPQEREVA